MTASLPVPPGVLLILGGLALPLLPHRIRQAVLLALPPLVLVLVWMLPDGVSLQAQFLGRTLDLVKADALSRLFATVFLLATFTGGLFALNQTRVTELAAVLAYAGAAVGVVFAGDLVSLFIFWEVMALASTLVICAAGPAARGAALRYAVIHLFGGVLLMAGIAGEIAATGSIGFGAMAADSPARWLILAGFLVNAGAPPLAAWLPDAYPESSWSGMVFLSAFTTKTAVYVLLRGFPGTEVLVPVGLAMVFYGIVYAILENDIRRILAYSIVSQVGFMVTGIGIGSPVALNGVAAHAFAHILYKALLLMSAGSVLFMTGRRRCTDLGGLFRTMPVTTACGIVGALSISAFPLTSGFVSKSMISHGAAVGHLPVVWFLLTAASAATCLYAGLRFPWFVFFGTDSGLRPADPPWNMRAAMLLAALGCIGIGVMPGLLYALLPYPVDYVPYTGVHVGSQLQLLLAAGLAFFLMLGWLQGTRTITLDVDWFWRSGAWTGVGRAADAAWAWFDRAARATGRTAILLARRHHGLEGAMARTWPTGAMAFWTAVMLAGYLLISYL